MRTRTIIAVVALLLASSACGVAGGGDDKKAEEAIAKELMSSNDSSFKLEQKQADCIGKGMVDKVGVDQMKEYGMLTDDLKADTSPDSVKMSKDDAEATADVFIDCADIDQLLRDQMQLGDMDPKIADCVDKALTDDLLHDFLVAIFQGDEADAASANLLEPLTKCMTGA